MSQDLRFDILVTAIAVRYMYMLAVQLRSLKQRMAHHSV